MLVKGKPRTTGVLEHPTPGGEQCLVLMNWHLGEGDGGLSWIHRVRTPGHRFDPGAHPHEFEAPGEEQAKQALA